MVRRLAQPEYDFGNSMPQRPMVIDVSESQVLEWQVPHPMKRRIDIRSPAAHLFEQCPQLIFQHLRSTCAKSTFTEHLCEVHSIRWYLLHSYVFEASPVNARYDQIGA